MFKLFYVFAQDSVILSGSSIFDGIHSKYLYYCCICKFLKELFSIVSCETWCKGKDFYFYLPNFFEVFFDLFFRKFFRNGFRTFAWIFQPHPSVSLFPDSLALFHHVTTASLSIAGTKVLAVKHIFQIFSQLFYNYFLLSLIVNDLQMHFSPLFYFPLPFLFLLSKFSIFNPTFSILKKPACFYHFTPAFQQKTPAFFPFMPIFKKQLNENRFQSSLDLLSIPVYPG